MTRPVEISPFRLHALAGYNLQPAISVTEEGSCLSLNGDKVLGMSYCHPVTGMFGSIILQLDDSGTYQIVQSNPYLSDCDKSEKSLRSEMNKFLKMPPPKPIREKPASIILPLVAEEELHNSFKKLCSYSGFSPAKEIIEAAMNRFDDVDGTFIKEFQTRGFDARLWELYIYLALEEDGLKCTRPAQRPDFLAANENEEFFVEAVTANPSQNQDEVGMPDDDASAKQYVKEYVPVKFGRPLQDKLKMKYWELPHVEGKPIVLAIQDFHFPGAMTYTTSGLAGYLYGLNHDAQLDAEGNLQEIVSQKVKLHKWQNKSIASGFFSLPGAEHISAVISNANATINKFNRIGYAAGFGDRDIKLIRQGIRWNTDPKAAFPIPFMINVHEPGYFEPWGEGINVYHNPNALRPVSSNVFRFGAHHRLDGDQIASSTRSDFHPISSKTYVITTY